MIRRHGGAEKVQTSSPNRYSHDWSLASGHANDHREQRGPGNRDEMEWQMKTAGVFLGVVGVAAVVMVGLVARGYAQTLPDGPNKALAKKICGSCHDTEMVAVNGRSRENWNGTIDEMIGYGMQISATDREQLLDYLATYLPPK